MNYQPAFSSEKYGAGGVEVANYPSRPQMTYMGVIVFIFFLLVPMENASAFQSLFLFFFSRCNAYQDEVQIESNWVIICSAYIERQKYLPWIVWKHIKNEETL